MPNFIRYENLVYDMERGLVLRDGRWLRLFSEVQDVPMPSTAREEGEPLTDDEAEEMLAEFPLP